MTLYKRGNTWWYEFIYAGKRVRESAKTSRKAVALHAEKDRRLDLDKTPAGMTPRDDGIKSGVFMMKRAACVLIITSLFAGRTNAQSIPPPLPPQLEAAAERWRIEVLGKAPKIQVMLPYSANTRRIGLSTDELLSRVEALLDASNVPFRSARKGLDLNEDVLEISIDLLDLHLSETNKPVIVYYISLGFLKMATISQMPQERERAVTVWKTGKMSLTGSADGISDAVLALVREFILDYLKANPTLIRNTALPKGE
jgi:hypothetical protein